jgi:hypothetical protein
LRLRLDRALGKRAHEQYDVVVVSAISGNWIGFMRHAKAWYDGMPDEEKSSEAEHLTTAGQHSAVDVGATVREFLKDAGDDPSLVTVYDVGTPQSSETAGIIRHQLGCTESKSHSTLNCLAPNRLSTYVTDLEELKERWSEATATLQSDARCIVVGHDPQMTWLLHLAGGRRTRWHTLAAGELILLETQADGAKGVRYIFSPSEPNAAKDLYAKIDSKMNTAKVLGTFLTALITFAATQVLGQDEVTVAAQWLAAAGLILLGIAAILYFVALFFYDELLMPKRYWSSGLPRKRKARTTDSNHVLRPPGSDVWVLYQNMLRIWNRAFIPATLMGGTGVALLALSLADPSGPWWFVVIPVLAVAVGLVAGIGHLARPRLGVND